MYKRTMLYALYALQTFTNGKLVLLLFNFPNQIRVFSLGLSETLLPLSFNTSTMLSLVRQSQIRLCMQLGQENNCCAFRKSQNISEDFAYLCSTLLFISCMKYLVQNSSDMDDLSQPILRFTLCSCVTPSPASEL